MVHRLEDLAATSPSAVWKYIFAGLCASLVSIGLARFAYTPLLPSLIHAQWFAAADVVYLGAANLAGYLFGALLGRPLAARAGNVLILRVMMTLVTLSFFACAFPLSVAWFFVWRLASGIAGGAIMVLVAATVLPHVPPQRRGLAGGAIFLGIGLGIAVSGTIVPLLLNFGLRDTWLGLGIFSSVLSLASWAAWPSQSVAAPATQAAPLEAERAERGESSATILYIEYALIAVGFVPTMVFLVDFVARGLGAGAHLGALMWVWYGVGAIFGPPVYGLLGDRIGGRPSLRVLLLVQTCAVAGLASTGNHLVLGALAVVIGSFPAGIVPLMLTRVHESIPGDHAKQHQVWSRATVAFATFQALSGYAYSAIFNGSGGDHRLLFLIGAGALATSLLFDLIVPLLGAPRRSAIRT